MRTLPAAALALALAASAAAQDQQTDAPAPPTPTVPMNLRLPSPGAAAAATNNSLKLVDEAIKDLSASLASFQDCVAGLDYLKKDLAATRARAEARGGGKIPSNLSRLIVLKTKRLGRQQQTCLTQTKLLDEHFTTVVRSLAGIQPPNHAGIPPRRQKVLQLREKFNAAVKKLGGKTAAAPAAGESASGDEGSDQQ